MNMERGVQMRMKDVHEAFQTKTNEYLYKIGTFATMNHITVKALRFYEAQGLLLPAHIDEESGYRYYTMSQMAVVHQITALKQAGFTLEDIARINAGEDKNAFLLRKKSELLGKIAKMTAQLAIIDGYLTKKETRLDTPVLIKTLPEVIVAAMRERIASYDVLFEIMPKMGEQMERAGCECAIPEYCFTNYLEPGYKDEDILVEICQAVTEEKPEQNGLYFRRMPQVEAACIYHKGSYDCFADTYEIVLRYIEENDYEIVGAIREKYIDGIWNKDDESEWLSEIQIPIRKRNEDELWNQSESED
ncbi:MAG: MerR family transcriptional regulator [Agathobacter sp.]